MCLLRSEKLALGQRLWRLRKEDREGWGEGREVRERGVGTVRVWRSSWKSGRHAGPGGGGTRRGWFGET